MPNNFYVSAYVKFNGNFASHYQKFFLTCCDTAQFYVNAGLNGDGTASGFALKDGAWGDSTKYGNVSWSKDQWHYWELFVDTTSSSGDRYTIWWDGEMVEHAFPGHSGAKAIYNELGVPNWSGGSAPFTMWVNRYVFSSARIYPASVFEISGDGGTWKHMEPVRLDDASAQIKVDLNGLSGTSYRLRVKNNQQQTSAVYMLGSVVAADAGMPADASSPPGQDASTPGRDASTQGVDAAGVPAMTTDLAVVASTSSSATLSFTEVEDGLGHPAAYFVRFSSPPMDWGAATTVSQGTCSTPMAGQSIGASRSCTVEGLSPATTYEFQLVAFRGTLGVNAVFGPLSNVAQGATAPGGGADAGQAGLDASNCVAGAPCSSADSCRTGTIDCVLGQPHCGHWADVADGTACQGSNVCSSGVCRACPAEAPCTTADGCRFGKTSCTTGEAVCEVLENAPNGTACGAQGACQQGVCSVCPAGEACGSFDGCQVGSIDCSRTPATCGAFTNRPDGVACSGGVCEDGICRSCTPGAACNLPEPCKVGGIVCTTGAPMCEEQGNLADGTLCAGGVCHAGRCEPVAGTDAGPTCGAGTHLDPVSGRCVVEAAVDAGQPSTVEAGCSSAAGASGPAALMALAGLLAIGLRRRSRKLAT
ncbi:MAG: fibronectin type III domain-containing protein [Deltaproteobacteria bacterium]|nr:fibronectin type III domain-containing protein [Deltaproteobacteria bacterium]